MISSLGSSLSLSSYYASVRRTSPGPVQRRNCGCYWSEANNVCVVLEICSCCTLTGIRERRSIYTLRMACHSAILRWSLTTSRSGERYSLRIIRHLPIVAVTYSLKKNESHAFACQLPSPMNERYIFNVGPNMLHNAAQRGQSNTMSSDAHSMLQFLEGFVDGSLIPSVRSQPVPQAAGPGRVVELVGSTFREKVLTPRRVGRGTHGARSVNRPACTPMQLDSS